MLTNEEKKEIEVLPRELKEKVLMCFESVFYKTFEAMYKQVSKFNQELSENAFQIRAEIDFDILKEKFGESADKIAAQMIMSARQNAETALKVIKELPDLTEQLESLRLKLNLSEEEVKQIDNKKVKNSKQVILAVKKNDGN